MYKIITINGKTVIFELYHGGRRILEESEDAILGMEEMSYKMLTKLLSALKEDVEKEYFYLDCVVKKEKKVLYRCQAISNPPESLDAFMHRLMQKNTNEEKYEISEAIRRVMEEAYKI